jgi:hypothetical protein
MFRRRLAFVLQVWELCSFSFVFYVLGACVCCHGTLNYMDDAVSKMDI